MNNNIFKRVLNKESNHVYIIAEIGINHNGDVNTALELIQKSYESGVDAVKFQKRNLYELYSKEIIDDPNKGEWNIEYLVKELKELELDKDDYDKIDAKCKELNLDLIITPFDIDSVDFILNYDIVAIKNASCNMNNYKLLNYISKKNLPVLISTGMWNDEEILNSISYFKEKNMNYVLLLSNSTYPCPYEDINIEYLNKLKNYSNIVGYSGHEKGIFVPIAAVALGARIIEKHITLDKTQEGLDHKASMEPNEWKEMVSNIRLLEKTLGDEKVVNQAEMLAKQSFCLSPYAKNNIYKDELFTEGMYDLLAPGKGILQNELKDFIGKKIKKDVKIGECIDKSFFEESSISISDWKIGKFNKKWGLKCRFHDFPKYNVLSSPIIEFHCSQKDMYDSISGIMSNTSQLVVHAPELVDKMLVDICANKEEQVNRSLDILQHSINKTIELSKNFKGKPKLVVHFGGMLREPSDDIELTRKKLLEKAINNFSKLNYDSKLIDILPENLPPKPWYLGGEWNQYGFMNEDDIIEFCNKFNLKITYDLCHAKLYCNCCNKNIIDFTKKVKKYVSHMHISDTQGINGEGVQIYEGDTNFGPIFEEMKDIDYSWVTEIWAGHLNNGKEQYKSMKLLEDFKTNL